MARPALHQGTLDVRYLRADVPVLPNPPDLGHAHGDLRTPRAERLAVHINSGPVALAADGRSTGFTFTSRPATLTLFRPADPH